MLQHQNNSQYLFHHSHVASTIHIAVSINNFRLSSGGKCSREVVVVIFFALFFSEGVGGGGAWGEGVVSFRTAGKLEHSAADWNTMQVTGTQCKCSANRHQWPSVLSSQHYYCSTFSVRSGCLPMMVVHPEFVGPRTRRHKTVFLCGLLVSGGLPWSPVPLNILCGGLQAMVCIIIVEYKLSTLSHSFCQ